jgi:glycosyltransferase involved in cell wall biosynthesis
MAGGQFAISSASSEMKAGSDVWENKNRGSRPSSRKLRILHVLFSSRIAGSERYCIDLANKQAELGHEVHVAGKYRSPIRSLLSPSVIYHSFSNPFLRGAGLRRLISRASIEVCHGHLSPACKAIARMPDSVAKIATLHVGFKARQHAGFDGLICVNGAQMTRLGDYAGEFRLIANWLPEQDRSEALDLRAKLKLQPDTLLIGGVGRLHFSKGFDVLISAFRNSAPADAALVIIGEGPHRAALKKLAAGDRRIHLLGYCGNVPGFLRNLDLFVSPSREESFGLAIVEAMQERLPIISTATEGPSEYLRSYPVPLVEPGSVERLSEALAAAIGLGRGATRIDYDMERFSRSAGVASVLDFYSEVTYISPAEAPNMSVPHVS